MADLLDRARFAPQLIGAAENPQVAVGVEAVNG